MRLSTAGVLSVCVLPAVCRVLPALLAQYDGTNTTPLSEVDGALPAVSDSSVLDLPLPQLLFTDPAPPKISSPDLHGRDIPTLTSDNLNAVERKGHNDGPRSQNTHSTNETIAPRTEDELAYATLAKRMLHDDPKWEKALCTGTKLVQAQMRPKDTAVNFVNPIDSEFDGTMEDDLRTWGYIDRSVERAAACDFSSVIPELRLLGINVDFSDRTHDGQNICYEVEHPYRDRNDPHSLRTYTVNNKLYFVIVCSCYGHTLD